MEKQPEFENQKQLERIQAHRTRYVIALLCAVLIFFRALCPNLRFDETSLLLFGILVLVLLLPELTELFPRWRVKLSGIELEVEAKMASREAGTKTAHAYWLGHDLMDAIRLVIEGADLRAIVASLDRSMGHAKALKLGEYSQELDAMRQDLQAQRRQPSREDRARYFIKLHSLRMGVGRYLAK